MWCDGRVVPYLVAEYPEKDRKEIFALSKQMMTGYKFDTFILELSFIGWFLLGVLACGIGTLFVMPYYEGTKAQLYLHLKEERLGIIRSNNGGSISKNHMERTAFTSNRITYAICLCCASCGFCINSNPSITMYIKKNQKIG